VTSQRELSSTANIFHLGTDCGRVACEEERAVGDGRWSATFNRYKETDSG
jgi:hypothetical protein